MSARRSITRVALLSTVALFVGACSIGSAITRTETVVRERWFACPQQLPQIECPEWPEGQRTVRDALKYEPKQKDAYICWREAYEIDVTTAHQRCVDKVKEQNER